MFGRLFCCGIGVCLYGFYRAFDGDSFEKKSTCYHFLKPKYMQNEIQSVFLTKMISEQSSTKSDRIKNLLNTLWLTAYGSIL